MMSTCHNDGDDDDKNENDMKTNLKRINEKICNKRGHEVYFVKISQEKFQTCCSNLFILDNC